jgi:hypothetical protein
MKTIDRLLSPVRPTTRLALVLSLTVAGWAVRTAAGQPASNRYTIDARGVPPAPELGGFQMGGPAAARSPAGRVLAINSRYLTLDGQPWLPVMGEFHFSRYPERLWEDEILKMKAGGIQIISTYVFWIHHEEVEGHFDWSGQRDLRRFVDLCAKHGEFVWVRIGPWAHGEVRNGGLPDWLMAKGPTRVNDPTYLGYVRTYYDEIGRQLQGRWWKDGGPIIGVQIENEYANRAPNAGAAHIATLKGLAIAAGMDAPVYTVTGWDNAVYPPCIVTPVFGGYPDEPWAGSRTDLPPDTQGVYQFAPRGGNAGILQGLTTAAAPPPLARYPRFTVELGAGMQLTYHRLVAVAAEDIPPIAISALGSGVTLLGYYMYHGGTNPDGQLSTLEESQATGYPNDVPVKSYDFQAPLREFGQVNGSFRKLKVIHQFIADFGRELAPMTRVLPDIGPTGLGDVARLRVAARTQGDRGFLFFNNYVRHYPLPDQSGVQVVLELPSETIAVPRAPVTVPSQSAFFWPVNLDMGGARLVYATAQPVAKLNDGNVAYFVFMALPGIAPEFAFAASTVAACAAPGGTVAREGARITVGGLKPSTDVALTLQTREAMTVRIVLLRPDEAEDAWKLSLGGRERLLITPADCFVDGPILHLRSRDARAFSLAVFPDFGPAWVAPAPWQNVGRDGWFAAYRAPVEPKPIAVGVEPIRAASPVGPVRFGPPFDWRHGAVAEAPNDADFAAAAVWRLTVPADALRGLSDVILAIRYRGDVGRLRAGGHLLDDNYYNGTPWEVGLRELAPGLASAPLDLEVLPLRSDAPIYLPSGARPDFGGLAQVAAVDSVQAFPVYEVTLAAPAASGAPSGSTQSSP